ncbi:glycosyltransferase [Clostridium sp. UBA1056]|uniref:glycosyltransferase n=1 Tax=unclassified Clostridium TaxID=2614128 RepID=UPI00321714F7
MKIFLLPSWYPSKEKPLDGIFFKEQAEALVKENIEVVVVNIVIKSINERDAKEEVNKLKFYEENGVKVYRYVTYNYIPRLTEIYLRYYSSILNKVISKIISIEGNPELIHIHSAIDAGIAYSKSKMTIPYVITEHSTKYARNILNNTQKKYLKDVFSNAKVVMAVGVGLKREISKYISEEKIRVIANPVIINDSSTTIDKNKKKFRFFSLGLLTNKKGMDALIEAYNSNRDNLKDVELYIGGNGEEFTKLQQLIHKYNLEKDIILLGSLNREEVAYHMKNCDCFILASRFETFGIVFVEAMYYGKPVIGTKTGGPDSFVNDECGILVEIDNVEQIGESMIRMVSSYSNYNSEYIKEYCRDNFSEKVIVEKLKSIYGEVIGESNDKRNNF